MANLNKHEKHMQYIYFQKLDQPTYSNRIPYLVCFVLLFLTLELPLSISLLDTADKSVTEESLYPPQQILFSASLPLWFFFLSHHLPITYAVGKWAFFLYVISNLLFMFMSLKSQGLLSLPYFHFFYSNFFINSSVFILYYLPYFLFFYFTFFHKCITHYDPYFWN